MLAEITFVLCSLIFVGFSFFITEPRDWLGRTSPKYFFCVEWDVKPYSVQLKKPRRGQRMFRPFGPTTSTLVGTSRIGCTEGFMKRYGVLPSVCPSVGVRLLLWARRAGDIDRLVQQRRANAGSAALSAYVGS